MPDILFPVAVFFASVFTSNILLTNYLGMCSFLAVSKELGTSAGLGIAVTFVMAVTTPLNWLVYEYLLVPFGLEYLRFIVFIIVIAAFVQLIEMAIERYSEGCTTRWGSSSR
jgi:Na+-transporting NADH:ubiquinone oxidoreductase subunit E